MHAAFLAARFREVGPHGNLMSVAALTALR